VLVCKVRNGGWEYRGKDLKELVSKKLTFVVQILAAQSKILEIPVPLKKAKLFDDAFLLPRMSKQVRFL
jgi:hypothetical protein